MERREKCTAIVLAAGKGKRMGTEIPKQFLHILDKPVIYYALECFQTSSIIDEVILVTSAEMISYCREEIVEAYGFNKVSAVIAGGAERYDSVYEGLKHCREADYVFIHDGARPFVDEEILHRGYELVLKTEACVAGVPAKDTIKIADTDGIVKDTPDRSLVWTVQTPQVFSNTLIRGAYEKLHSSDKIGITDDAMVVEQTVGHAVHLFLGSYRNIKITTTEDLAIAEVFCKNNIKKL